MKTGLRFSIHFVIGLIAWMLGLGLTMMISVEVLFPLLGLLEGQEYYDLYILAVFGVNITACSVLFGWYFGSPLKFMMSWIASLSGGNFEPPPAVQSIFKRNRKLKSRYRLYGELIVNIQSLSASLRQAELERRKLEENKKDWVAGISHDLKTPLTYVTGYSTLLLNEEYSWNADEQRTFLQEIHSKGLHIEELISDINLSFQMNEDHASLPMQLGTLELIGFLQRLTADVGNDPRAVSHLLSLETETELLELVADEKLLYRALQNVLMNAVLHNPAGTAIHVTVRREGDESVSITISDNGTGMNEDTLKNLFQKYYRGAKDGSPNLGTGLGMAIVKKLILAHGGFLTVESEVSKGTAFHISLPVRQHEKSP
ncbi:sensor histidine kinase [Paenibacillus graminis]|uniref:histidine kinase n=1 Tax=Paenibacillus graminis TaxID=189425 RepID=A0A089M9L4_9BACL|nr:HAMP domain-containing sensor histidine kinase [Paenibacillus graminis]AIQ68213.1 histidine kinase [Paenibacillus graminis]